MAAQEHEHEIPWIHLDLLTAKVTGANLVTTMEQSEQLARQLDKEIWRDTKHTSERSHTTLSEPHTEIDSKDRTTKFMVQIYDEDGSLPEELEWVADLITRSVEISDDTEEVEALRIRLCMNTTPSRRA